MVTVGVFSGYRSAIRGCVQVIRLFSLHSSFSPHFYKKGQTWQLEALWPCVVYCVHLISSSQLQTYMSTDGINAHSLKFVSRQSSP